MDFQVPTTFELKVTLLLHIHAVTGAEIENPFTMDSLECGSLRFHKAETSPESVNLQCGLSVLA
jgi:hypothetical protein